MSLCSTKVVFVLLPGQKKKGNQTRKNIVAAVASILTAGVTYLNAQTNTNTTGGPFWVQNVSFTLQAQTTSGKRVISTKDIIADMSGITVTNTGGGTNSTTVTNSVTVTNAP